MDESNGPPFSIEDEPEFALFLALVAEDAAAHPEKLRDIGALTAGDDELFCGVCDEGVAKAGEDAGAAC